MSPSEEGPLDTHNDTEPMAGWRVRESHWDLGEWVSEPLAQEATDSAKRAMAYLGLGVYSQPCTEPAHHDILKSQDSSDIMAPASCQP